MMVNGIKPIWEDPRNENGGFWSIRVKKEDSPEVWKELILAVIGEQFTPFLEEGDDINGVTVSLRQTNDIIQVWNRRSSEQGKDKIFKKVRNLLPNINFEAHYYKECKSHNNFGI